MAMVPAAYAGDGSVKPAEKDQKAVKTAPATKNAAEQKGIIAVTPASKGKTVDTAQQKGIIAVTPDANKSAQKVAPADTKSQKVTPATAGK